MNKQYRFSNTIHLLLVLTMAALLSACGGSGSSDAPTTGNSQTNSTPVSGVYPRFAYTANYSDNSVSIYSVDADTGQLRHQGFVATPEGSSAIAVEPSGKYAYVANFNSGTISIFSINAANGTLTSIGESVSAGAGAVGITTDLAGKYLYVTSYNNSMAAFSIDASTGALTLINAIPAQNGRIAQYVGRHPSGKFLYVASLYTDDVLIFSIDAGTGAVTQSDTVVVGRSPSSIAFDPLGKFAYVTNHDASTISIFNVNATTGALTPAGTLSTISYPVAMVLDASGQTAYVVGVGGVKAYGINGSTGLLTALHTYSIPEGGDARSIDIDPTGKFLYITNGDVNTVSTLKIDPTTRIPSPLASTAWRVQCKPSPRAFALLEGTSPVKIVPKFAYAANADSGDVSAFSINPDTGALSNVGTAVAAGTTPAYVAVDSSARFAYVANSGSNNVTAYGIDTTTGALTSVGAATAGVTPSAIAVDLTSRFAYVANSGDGSVHSYTMGATGALSAVNTISTSLTFQTSSIVVDSTGTYVVVTGAGDTSIRAYRINNATGELDGTFYRTDTAGTSPAAIARDPSGRFIYVANFGSNTISVHSLDSFYGTFNYIDPTIKTAPSGVGPKAIVVDPLGKFAYAANATEGSISAYTINYETGALTQLDADPAMVGVQNFSAGTNPNALSVDASGKYLYVTQSGNVSIYAINRTTGALTGMGAVAAGTSPKSIVTAGVLQ